jgi:alpha-L-rhamnosidase
MKTHSAAPGPLGSPWLLLLLLVFELPALALNLERLRCEDLRQPEGIAAAQPRLSWVLSPGSRSARGERQSAYQVLVSSSPEKLAANQGDLWDSGRVASDESIRVGYVGSPLVSGQQCFWKARAWDADGKPGPWSAAADWSMGLLAPSDWHARWIGLDEAGPDRAQAADRRLPARWLRKEFAVEKKVRRATVYYSGLGLSELYLNGRRVGDEELSPGLTEYTRRVFYVTHEVGPGLRPGANALGVVLGNGFYFNPRGKVFCASRSFGFPKLLLQMRIEYEDGSTSTVVSDGTWKLTTEGPIRANNEFDGEEYDARLELGSWSLPGYDDAKWQPPQLVSAASGAAANEQGPSLHSNLCPQMIEPIRVTQTLKPVAVTEPAPGTYIFDLGQNMVGRCRLHVSGPRGTAVTLRHAETLKPDGTLYMANLRSVKATDIYILKGQGSEVYEPRFTYHGFRYVEVSGYPGKPPLSALAGRVVHDDLESAGEFSCSEPLLNHIYRNIVWGVSDNYRSIPTDCPQRDERLGWLGDRSVESKGETYLFDVAALYRKWLQDMADSQKESGSMPDLCPAYRPVYSDNVTWPSTSVMVPSALLDQYGDLSVVEEHYASARKWMEYMGRFVTNGIIARDAYGDWCVPPEDPKLIHSKDPKRKTNGSLLATAYFYKDAQLMAEYARQLGRADDAAHFTELAETLKTAFNTRFLHDGQYDNGSQTSCVLPLSFGLVPKDAREQVFAHLLDKIEGESQGTRRHGLDRRPMAHARPL